MGPARQRASPAREKTPATSHEVRLSEIEAWRESGGRSPNEQAMKVRLREFLGL
jgi:hypothetical protein